MKLGRKSVYLITILGITLTGSALAQKKGILFRASTVGGAFEAARKAKKPLFLEVFSPTCHVCESFVPTLAESRVGTFYNARFVSAKVDVNTPETQNFLRRNRLFVPSLPLFLYFSPQGDLIHMAMSSNTPEEVIRHGSNALNPTARGANMRNRYQQGERSPNFLIDYGMWNRVNCDTLTGIQVMNEYVRQQPAGSYSNMTNWLVLQKLILDVDNPLFQYLISHLNEYAKYGQNEVRNVAENILMSSLYSSRGNQYPVAKILKIRDQLQQIGIDGRVASNRTLLPEVNAYFRMGQTARAAARMDSHAQQNQFSLPEYLYVIRLFNGRSPDSSDVSTVLKWANKALTQTKNGSKEQADVYYEMAEAYRRSGKNGEAVNAAQKSLEIARAARLDTKRNTDQLARLK